MNTASPASMRLKLSHRHKHCSALFGSAMLTIAFALAGLSSAARAGDETKNSNSKLTEELKQLQTKAGQFESFKVKFEQQVYSALRKKTNKSDGELIFAQPRRFRWEINSPNKEVYVNNNEWFWKYVESTKHAIRLPANSGDLEFLDVIFALDKLQNRYRLQRINQLTDLEGKPSKPCGRIQTCVRLEPLQNGQQKNIELSIDQSNGFVNVVRIDFRNGNRTLINFTAFKEGKISPETFDFNPPPGTAVDKR